MITSIKSSFARINLSRIILSKPQSHFRCLSSVFSPPFVRLSHGGDDRRRSLANFPVSQDDRSRRVSSMSQPSTSPPSSKMSTETGFVTLDSAQLFTKTWIVNPPFSPRPSVYPLARHRSYCHPTLRAWVQWTHWTLRSCLFLLCGAWDKDFCMGRTWIREKCD